MRRAPSKLHVTVVANNPQTLDGLHDYFARVGVESNGTRELQLPARESSTTGLVLFPDDFELGEVQRFVGALRRSRPKLLLVLVTSAPQRLGSAIEPDESSLLPLVMPKPAFGWTILDAIRGHADDARRA
jgi:hypothetical protein